MFRNPVYDLLVLVPAFLAAGLLSFFVVAPATHAATTEASSTPFYTSTSTLPDPEQKLQVVIRGVDVPEATSSTDGEVRTSSDLPAYAKQLMVTHEAITSVTTSAEGVEITYVAQKKLLGVIPMMLVQTIHITSDGTVEINEPWYGSMATSEHRTIQNALEVRARTLLSSEGYTATTLLSPMTQAQLLLLITDLIG